MVAYLWGYVKEFFRNGIRSTLESAKAEGQARAEQGDEKAAANGLLVEYNALKKSSEGMSRDALKEIQARMNEIRQDSSVSEAIQKRDPQTWEEKNRYLAEEQTRTKQSSQSETEKSPVDTATRLKQWGEELEAEKPHVDTDARLQQWEREIEEEKQQVSSILESAKAEAQARAEQGDEKAAANGLLVEYNALKKSTEGVSKSVAEEIQARMNEIRQDPSVSAVIQKREAA